MTKAQFKKLKVGYYVKVITALFGYQDYHLDGEIYTAAGLGPWTGFIKAIGNGIALVSFPTSESSWATGLHTYPEIVSKTKNRTINRYKDNS